MLITSGSLKVKENSLVFLFCFFFPYRADDKDDRRNQRLHVYSNAIVTNSRSVCFWRSSATMSFTMKNKTLTKRDTY